MALPSIAPHRQTPAVLRSPTPLRQPLLKRSVVFSSQTLSNRASADYFRSMCHSSMNTYLGRHVAQFCTGRLWVEVGIRRKEHRQLDALTVRWLVENLFRMS